MRIDRTIEVDTTPAKAYKVLSDPTNIPRYAPDIDTVVITSITPRLIGTRMTMTTREQREINAEVVTASQGKECAFRTDNGQMIRWVIESNGGHTRLVNTIESEEEMDETRIIPELDRKLRHLRNQFQRVRP